MEIVLNYDNLGERGNLVHLQFVGQNITWYKIIAWKKQCEGWKMRSSFIIMQSCVGFFCVLVNVCETHVHIDLVYETHKQTG